jgi:hypothetical protein
VPNEQSPAPLFKPSQVVVLKSSVELPMTVDTVREQDGKYFYTCVWMNLTFSGSGKNRTVATRTRADDEFAEHILEPAGQRMNELMNMWRR